MKIIDKPGKKSFTILVLMITLNFFICELSVAQKNAGTQLMGNRFFTLCSFIRVNQIEVSRDSAIGTDESNFHTAAAARLFRETVSKTWPEASITWAFSWLALKDQRPNYLELKKLVISYHKMYGDEITFLPGGFFAEMFA